MPTPKPCTSLNERKVKSVIVILFYIHLHLYTVANLYQIFIFFYFQYVQYWYKNVRYAQVCRVMQWKIIIRSLVVTPWP